MGVAVVQECNSRLCNGMLLPASSFYFDKLSSDGLCYFCKKCEAHYHRQQRQLSQEVPYGAAAAFGQSAPDLRCSWCEELKPANEFYRLSHVRSGRQDGCKSCRQAKLATRTVT